MGDASRGAMSRSMFAGSPRRDNAEEVARRRAAMQHEIEERREASRRLQEEKMARAAAQKEERLHKQREAQQRELQRAQAAHDRRVAVLAEEKEKKAVAQAKAEQATARMLAQQKTRPVFAFGSSTPRELGYLTHLTKEQKVYDRKLQPSGGYGSPCGSQIGRSSLAPIRSHAIGNSSMTRSMYITRSEPRRPPSTANVMSQSMMLTSKSGARPSKASTTARAHTTPRNVPTRARPPIRIAQPNADVSIRSVAPRPPIPRPPKVVAKQVKEKEASPKAVNKKEQKSEPQKLDQEDDIVAASVVPDAPVVHAVLPSPVVAASTEEHIVKEAPIGDAEAEEVVKPVVTLQNGGDEAEIDEIPAEPTVVVQEEIKSPIDTVDDKDGAVEERCEEEPHHDPVEISIDLTGHSENGKIEDSIVLVDLNTSPVKTEAESPVMEQEEIRAETPVDVESDEEVKNNEANRAFEAHRANELKVEKERKERLEKEEKEKLEREERRARLAAIVSRTRAAPTAIVNPTTVIRDQINAQEPLKDIDRVITPQDPTETTATTRVLSQTTTSVLQKLASSNPRLMSVLRRNGSNPSLADELTAADPSLTLPGQPDEPVPRPLNAPPPVRSLPFDADVNQRPVAMN